MLATSKHGTFTVTFEPMDYVSYMVKIRKRTGYTSRSNKPGYLVTRHDDGHQFWSPSKTFKTLFEVEDG